jgi:periplasmic divalent cation tolerance protein
VLVTWPADRDAANIARTLVEEGLAACVNVTAEMDSTYRWQGKVSVDRERQLFLKTTLDRVEALLSRVRALHPYEVPEFLVLPASAGSAQYLAWLQGDDVP